MYLEVVDAEKCVGCQCCMFACSRVHKDTGLSKTCISVRSAGGMQRGFLVTTCIACEDPPCARACPEDALFVRKMGGVLLKKEKCIGCGACRRACIINAVFWDEENNKPLICFYCGYCAKYCHYGVIELRKTEKEMQKKLEAENGKAFLPE